MLRRYFARNRLLVACFMVLVLYYIMRRSRTFPGGWNSAERHTMGKSAGLQARDDWFWIDGKKTRLFSGAMHYFRIPRVYWRDRLVKLRASGCNVLETYVPWNLHEPKRGEFDFEEMLDLRAYVKLAQECGLFVILRPGPYICSEWDLGGLPSWLLTDADMKLRSTYEPFISAVRFYFKELLPHVTDLQYSNGGGPVIAWQIENEYGTFGRDTNYLLQIQQIMVEYGVAELMFTSDNEQGILHGAVDGVLMTANFQNIDLGKEMLGVVQSKQPGMPRMCMEFWTGWFDHWGDQTHQTWSLKDYVEALKYILTEYGSMNFYMFHGGTNFAFMNGANEQTENDQLQSGQDYLADVTSYDYDALLTENGAITAKYAKTVELLQEYSSEVVYMGEIPSRDSLPTPVRYGAALTSEVKGQAIAMEMLPVYSGNGQAYGWTLYRKTVTEGGRVYTAGRIRDRTQVFLDGQLVTTFDCNSPDFEFTLPAGGTLDFLVENMGRTNYQPMDKDVLNTQRKGLNNRVTVNEEELSDWTVYCLDFTDKFLARLKAQQYITCEETTVGPVLLRGHLEVTTPSPSDTFLDMKGWGKGIVVVNGRNLGRYWPGRGPTKTMYVPGPWLKQGKNEILVFELERVAGKKFVFTETPELG